MILVRWEEHETNADLFVSHWDGRLWSPPEAIKSINTSSDERSPAFSRDGQFLYFSSNREGGKGGLDLYLARRNGSQWEGVVSLGDKINTADDESGPALSSDDKQLFFSSNREGAKGEDIFVADSVAGIRKAEDKLAPVPRFLEAEAVSHLNSRAHDVQAALTARGNHVFLASDRDSSGRKGYAVYFSRVVAGVSLKPEKVDLYIKQGNVTDPAVRMDGFDLLFSANHETDSSEDDPNYRLYRSTTREVIGYTDLSRWEQFKELLGNVAWWLILAVAALIALIYLLESWQDISSLFHKCLAGSAIVHLLMLVGMAALVIAQELEKQAELPPSEIQISLDALTEQELALESVPEETEVTQPDLSLPAEKAAANFEVPELQPQEEAQAMNIDAQFQQEAMQVEVKTANANPIEEHNTQPVEPSALLSELSETVLPEPNQPVLDEREFADAPEAANPEDSEFKPNETLPAPERSESGAVADTAMETPPEVAEVEPSETIADDPAQSALIEVTPTQSNQAEGDQSDAPQALESELLAELPDSSPLESEQVELDEGEPNAAAEPANESFTPDNSVAGASSAQAESEAVSDAAAQSQAQTSEVANGGVAAAPVAEGPASPVGEATNQSELPEATITPGQMQDLPAAALLDTGTPRLDEGDPNPNQAPANPANEQFTPNGAVAENSTTPLEGSPTSDAAVPSQADAAEVASGEVSNTPLPASPTSAVGEAQAEESVPATEIATGLSNNLPETALLDPGAPQLEEGDGQPAAPANPGEETFKPGAASSQPVASQKAGGAPSDSALNEPTEATEVGKGELAATPAQQGSASAVGEAQSEEGLPGPSALANNLPEASLLDPGAPQLEEGDGQPAAPANPGEETFKPGAASSQPVASQKAGGAPSDSALNEPTEATEVGKGELAATPAQQGSASAVGEAQSEEGLPGPSALANNLPEASLLDPGAPQLEEGDGQPAAPANPGEETFKPGAASSQPVASQKAGGAPSDSALNEPTEATEVGKGELAATPAQQGSASAVGEAQSEEGLPGPSALANNLPEASLLDPGTPTLEEGAHQGAPADSSKDQFKPGAAQLATAQASGGPASDQASSSAVDAGTVSGAGLVAENPQLTGPQSGLEAGVSETPTTAGTLGAASLEPTLTSSLLPGKLEAPEGDTGAMTDFLKKQRGRPSLNVIKGLGGSDGTEKAIEASIRWLAENQEKSGRWNSREHGAKGNFDTGVTGLALLCFYGWGARHDEEGEYRQHVGRALDWLLSQQEQNGNLRAKGMMYCHSIASIALCEAYGVTKDPKLREPAERAIAYTLAAQSKTKGGWRYRPGNDSDTSITGWQFMALHSARLAGLKVPEKHFELARKWFDTAGGGKHGGLYGYQGPGKKSPAMVATGMFCRQLDLAPPTSPKQIESAKLIGINPMRSRTLDFYYIYYATLALYQHQGPIWDKWNEALKDSLPRLQRKTGSRTGSWDTSRGLAGNGGRVASTALATLSLEVYYRILPIYGFRGEEEQAPELKEKENKE